MKREQKLRENQNPAFALMEISEKPQYGEL